MDHLVKLDKNLENSWSYEIDKVISEPYWYILVVPLMYLSLITWMCVLHDSVACKCNCWYLWDRIRIELIMFPMLF